ncbi:hypothetical protein D0T84_21215 [Dysgonomonas sp. 521]|uniref:hypothetical protein n=1 Tax=Dysgonomonas sp. 521 TaxID=2302932 RepID=UPI0013D855CC|nr:hypothetical protein [Dysgonomonas sp. 521]NDV97397.1 hypothetical protein [Dysgonomonas sp. 521]
MSNNHSSPLIRIPNLSLAIVVTVIAIAVQLLFNQPLWNVIGLKWMNLSAGVYLGRYLFQICVYYIFAQYLRNFRAGRLVGMLYAAVTLVFINAIMPLLSYALYGNQIVTLILSSVNYFASLVTNILFFIIGFKLIKFQSDFVGGLNFLGKTFVLKSVFGIITFLYQYSQVFISAIYPDYLPDNTAVINIIIQISALLISLFIFGSIVYIYKRAMDYNSGVEKEPRWY